MKILEFFDVRVADIHLEVKIWMLMKMFGILLNLHLNILQVVEFMLRKVMEEFERHLLTQRKQVTKVRLLATLQQLVVGGVKFFFR